MLWHNSFRGGEPGTCGGLANASIIFGKIRLASAKIKRRINRNRALRYRALGCGVTYRIDDDIDDEDEEE